MQAQTGHTYLNTRVAILRARLLSERTIADLIAAPLDEGLAERLGPALADPELDTAAIERSLMRALLADLAIILRPLTGTARDFFVFWARRFELFNLKSLIRGKLRHLPDTEVERHLQDMPSFTVLDHERLLRTESVAELLRQIEAGPYGDIARQARRALDEKQDTLAVEAAIDQRYYTGLVKRVHQLEKLDLEAMHALLGVTVDKLNLTWIIRFRFAYGLSPTETYYYLIRHGYHLKHYDLLALVELEECDAVMAALPSALRAHLEGVHSPLEIERRLEDVVTERARVAVRRSPSVITRALAYLLLRECELNRLRAIVHGKRLGLGADLLHIAVGNDREERH